MNNPIQESLAALSNYLVGDSTMGDTLARVCEATLSAVGTARFAGITMAVDAHLGTYVATHPVVEEIDATQYSSGEGPCVEALSTGQVVLVRSTFEDGPYREFRSAARRRGILSVLALPMRTGSEMIGALNLYAEEIDPHSGRHLGNFPQAFTHLALINAVMHVIRAEHADPARAFPPLRSPDGADPGRRGPHFTI